MTAVTRLQGANALGLRDQHLEDLKELGLAGEEGTLRTFEVNGVIEVWQTKEGGLFELVVDNGTIVELPATGDIAGQRSELLRRLTEGKGNEVFAFATEGYVVIGSAGGATF